MADTSFVTAVSLASHVNGSYEHLRERLETALRGRAAKLFGMNPKLALVATHPDHVVVAVEGRGVYRVAYAALLNEVVFRAPERVSAMLVEASGAPDYVRHCAQEALRALVRGDEEAALEASAAIFPFATSGLHEAHGAGFGWGKAPLSLWRQLISKQMEGPLPEGQPVCEETPTASMVGLQEALRVKDQLKALVAQVRERYAQVSARILVEGSISRVGELTLREVQVILEGVHHEALNAMDALSAMLAKAEPPLAALRKQTNMASVALPAQSCALATLEALIHAEN